MMIVIKGDHVYLVYDQRNDTYLNKYGTWSYGKGFAKVFFDEDDALEASDKYASNWDHMIERVHKSEWAGE